LWRQLLNRNIAIQLGEKLANHCQFDCPSQFTFSLSRGWAGFAVAFQSLFRATREERWNEYSHRAIENCAKRLLENRLHSCGLYGGLAGVALAIRYCAPSAKSESRLATSCYALLVAQTREQLITLRANNDAGIPWTTYDVISGLSGSLLALFDYAGVEENVIHDLINALIELLRLRPNGNPGTFTSNNQINAPALRGQFPSGGYNTGLAHGISGIIACLSLATNRNPSPETQAALEKACDWLVSVARTDKYGLYWYPCEDRSDHGIVAATLTSGWCYGSPGIAVALASGGAACGRQDFLETAHGVLSAALVRCPSSSTPGLCHGTAGVYEIVKWFCRSFDDRDLRTWSEKLRENLQTNLPELLASAPEFLEGYAGIICSLVDTEDAPIPWQRVLTLA
jgi:lantibiotic modifying enzyme